MFEEMKYSYQCGNCDKEYSLEWLPTFTQMKTAPTCPWCQRDMDIAEGLITKLKDSSIKAKVRKEIKEFGEYTYWPDQRYSQVPTHKEASFWMYKDLYDTVLCQWCKRSIVNYAVQKIFRVISDRTHFIKPSHRLNRKLIVTKIDTSKIGTRDNLATLCSTCSGFLRESSSPELVQGFMKLLRSDFIKRYMVAMEEIQADWISVNH
jgi:hypothetical protein